MFNLEDLFIDLDEELEINALEDVVDPGVKENIEKAKRQRYQARNRAKHGNRSRFLAKKKKLLHLDDGTSD